MSARRYVSRCSLLVLIGMGVLAPADASFAQGRDYIFMEQPRGGLPGVFDRVFKPRERRAYRRIEDGDRRVIRRSGPQAERRAPQPRAAAPIKKVAPPTFKTFSAEKLAAVDFSALGSVRPERPALVSSGLFLSLLPRLENYRLEAEKDVGEALTAFYTTSPEPLWLDGLNPNQQAKAALALLQSAEDDGLRSADYELGTPVPGEMPAIRETIATPVAVTEPETRENALPPSDETTGAIEPGSTEDSLRELAIRFEMALSARFLRYGRDLAKGRLDADSLSGFHDLPRQSFDGAALLRDVAQGTTPASAARALAPKDPAYGKLLDELADVRRESSDLPHIEGRVLWKPGTTDPRFADFLEIVKTTGSSTIVAEYEALFTDGGDTYTEAHIPLIKALQADAGLSQDGVIGPRTISALVPASPAEKIEKIQLSLERLRWLPRELGPRRVFINQPEYVARYYENGVEDTAMDVVVGTSTNQTNFFYDEIETVVFRPYWGVPRSIIINEYLAKLRNDPSYFDRNGYEVVQGGRQVASSSVNWWTSSSNLNVGVRQKPGPSNALGEIKILFPNRHNIYMHDTPAKHLFSRSSRAYSHGCVRLADPRLMAAKVLGTDVGNISARLASATDGERQKVAGNIPVYVGYFTAWPAKDGKVNVFDDVYGRDNHLQKSLQAVSESRAIAGT